MKNPSQTPDSGPKLLLTRLLAWMLGLSAAICAFGMFANLGSPDFLAAAIFAVAAVVTGLASYVLYKEVRRIQAAILSAPPSRPPASG